MQKKISVILTVVIFCALLVFVDSRGMLTGAKSFISNTSSPVSLFFSGISERSVGFLSGIFNLSKLQKENAGLKEEVNKLQAEIAQLSEAKKENERLKKDLGFITNSNFDYLAAETIAFDPSNLRGTITVNKGESDGITNEMAVVSDGFMVGEIIETSKNTSKIQLITDPASAIPAAIQGTTTSGIVKGEIGSGLTMEKIPQGDPVKEGDVVITSGLGGKIPKGLIIGNIENINSQENSLFIDASVRTSSLFGLLYRVIIIKG